MDRTSEPAPRGTITAPLRHVIFRRMWSASLLSNFGLLIQAVGAAWAMTELTGSADMVALVQTATMAPLMLLALAAGAIADMHDRRIVGLVSLVVAFAGAAALTGLTWIGLLSPGLILLFCFVIGSGIAVFSPAWQASVSEQVPAPDLPAAVALNSISYNIARSFGPAIGGVIVAVAGAAAAFLVNALFFLPMIVVLLLWRRVQEPSRLPPETLSRAIISGVRYVLHSPPIRIVILRTVILGTIGCAASALMPLIARDLLGGTARTYGVMLGCFGVGAVLGAMLVAPARDRLGAEATVRACAVLMAATLPAVALSRSAWITGPALILAGVAWIVALAICNILVQTMAPRWVAGRALAAFGASIAGGIAIGSAIWGGVAVRLGVDGALLTAATASLLSAAAGLALRMPHAPTAAEEAVAMLADPEVELALSGRSGPIIVEIEYRVPRHRARAFYGVMQDVELSRQRNGAYGWSIARDVRDPELWTERYHCPTWYDYLRQRNRPTQAERELHDRALAFHAGTRPPRIRRMLERPFGSVRWREDVRDRAVETVLPVGPGAGGP